MSGALLLALALGADAATVKLIARDAAGRELDLQGVLSALGRADEKPPRDPESAPFWAAPVDGRSPKVRVKLAQTGPFVTATWPGDSKARFELVWPVDEDGYNAVAADNGGEGFSDGAAVFLDEEIAHTQYRRFKESWRRRTTDWSPLYKPGKKAKELADAARERMASATAEKDPAKRGAAFRKALHSTAIAWEKELFEHGLQIVLDERRAKGARFGLTLDESLLKRLDDVDWLAEAVRRSGTDWVRLVFRPNPSDFLYRSLRSFNEYDGVVERLRQEKISVMGCVLDTAQWPRKLTPEHYAERVKNLVLHYKGKIAAWEIGSEINGDWLGGAADPFPPEQVFKIYSAGAAAARQYDPEAQLVATLYWWEQTAPDYEHSTSGWLKTFVPKGFGRHADIVGLDFFPEDNPVGMGFEPAFDALSEALPGKPVMLTSFGYVEKDELRGYWWLAPDDIDGARKDLVILFTTASCAMKGSLCGGFWWQTLEQMLPPGRRKATDLFKVYHRTLDQLGRRD